ncbi:MAG: Cutinase, partial [Thermoleophilia bacterium]|nr:Cutinase [Thermoleophilia bacterium]
PGTTVDGGIRTGMLATAAVGTAAAVGAALLRLPRATALTLGAMTGLAGAAVLVGPGSTPAAKVVSIGRFVSERVHASYVPRPVPVADLVPTTAPSRAEPAADASDARSTQLTNLPGTPDLEFARANAERALDELDFSKRDLVVWVPGTGGRGMDEGWERAVAGQLDGEQSHVFMDYPASWFMPDSAATGMETLKLVLAGIAERGGDHRVLLAGQSQGAWVIGDVLAHPELRAVVDRAVLFGHPGVASADYADRRDPKVMEVNDDADPVPKLREGREELFAAMQAAESGDVVGAVLAGAKVPGLPGFGAYSAAKLLDPERWNDDGDPHIYTDAFADAARWLDSGTV